MFGKFFGTKAQPQKVSPVPPSISKRSPKADESSTVERSLSSQRLPGKTPQLSGVRTTKPALDKPPQERQRPASDVRSNAVEDELDNTPVRALSRRQVLPATRTANSTVRGEPREPNEKELESILNNPSKVLTAENGVIQIGTQQRTVIAALENGVLVVAKSARASSAVSSVRLLLEKGSFQVTQTYFVDLEVIRKIYENDARRFGVAEVRSDTAQMQRAVIDLVKTAAKLRCSDIHITVSRHEAVIRIRSDGVMMKLDDLPSATAMELCHAAFNMADASDAAYKPFDYQGARISSLKTSLPEGVQAVRLQFNPLPDNGRYLVMRLLYSQKVSGPIDVDDLGYAAPHIRQIKRMRDKPFGIVIISGPTGSGKSTTLQTALQATAQQKNFEVNIITVEDPPEYEIRGAAQLPVVNVKTEEERREAFRAAITASLRSDPDIVMIGEIRDEASASLAFQAAMTGHQVYASLHANDALSILDRLRDQKVEGYKLADASLVSGLIGQRLVRQLCDHCKLTLDEGVQQGSIPPDMVILLENMVGHDLAHDNICVAKKGGCDHCSKRGYSGRTVIAETILPDRAFMELIAAHKKHEAYEHWLEHLEGMTMLEHAILKMVMGQVDPREIGDKVGILDEARVDRVQRLISQEVLPLLAGKDSIPVPRVVVTATPLNNEDQE